MQQTHSIVKFFRYLHYAIFNTGNLLAMATVGIAGAVALLLAVLGRSPWFMAPAIWIAGLTGEIFYVLLMLSSRRFREWVDRQQALSPEYVEQERRKLLWKLPEKSRRRAEELDRTVRKIHQILDHNKQHNPDEIDNRKSIENLRWTFLRLLLTRQHLKSLGDEQTVELLQAEIRSLEQKSAEARISNVLRESHEATRKILEQRIRNFKKKEEVMERIESDLNRIEAQLALTLEQATLRGYSDAIAIEIKVDSYLLDDSMLGEHAELIQQLEAAYEASVNEKCERSADIPKREA